MLSFDKSSLIEYWNSYKLQFEYGNLKERREYFKGELPPSPSGTSLNLTLKPPQQS